MSDHEFLEKFDEEDLASYLLVFDENLEFEELAQMTVEAMIDHIIRLDEDKDFKELQP